jgi:ubiquinol-cytochrome c reductase cytochrome c1 subunit
MRWSALAAFTAVVLTCGAVRAQEASAPSENTAFGADWESWRPGNSVSDLASLQRGARDFFGYCSGCHSLRFMRYSRIGQDLEIPPDMLQKYIVPGSAKASDYVLAPMPAADATTWFGKEPPDLSLMARERGTDYLYQFLTTFYVDPARPTGANNLRLDSVAMPDVLSEVEGLKKAVFKNVEIRDGGNVITQRVFDHFEPVVAGRLSREEYLGFVRDLVNFLDYAGEPAQVHRRSLGVWVVLFLLVLTWLVWLLKKEYWKDVH